MNLKHFYYRGYFDKGIDLHQHAKKKKTVDREKLEKSNEILFREKNRLLTSTEKVSAFSPVNFQKIGVEELNLQVQNPGLLPGIGYPHEVGYQGEFKLGFGFDHVTGLPVLPGSSVKGVLRSVFPQFKLDPENPGKIVNPDARQRQKAKYILGLLERLSLEIPEELKNDDGQKISHALELAIFCGWDTTHFFTVSEKMKMLPMSKHDSFLDALPVAFVKDQLLGRDALTPHGDNPLENPIPLPFVKVMPGVTFGFYFRLSNTTIGSVHITPNQKLRLFAEILCTVGAGAKTNVGYGQFEVVNPKDRLPRKMELSSAAYNQIIESTVPIEVVEPLHDKTAAKIVKLPFNRSLQGKKIIGEVISQSGENPVRFRITNVQGFEGERGVKVPESLLEKFKIGQRFNLTAFEVKPEKNLLNVKIEDYKPLP